MAKERGFKIVRLPPYHCRFNPPIELIWVHLKIIFTRHNTAPKFSSKIINLITEEVNKTSKKL